MAPLFEPFSCRGLRLRNRIVMAPMTRYGCVDGHPTPAVADYYGRRAAGEVGLIVSEGIFVDRAATHIAGVIPRLNSGRASAWQAIVDAVHSSGCAFAPQLWHVGASKDFNIPELPPGHRLESPSGQSALDLPEGHALSEEDVGDVIASFARAAAQMREIGCDAIELHGAHGYLLEQFFWSATNRRTDSYGGDTIRERSRFACELIKAVRLAVGPDCALLMRVSQWKTYFYDVRLANSPDELEAWLGPMADAGIDIFDCSQRRFWTPEFPGSPLNLAGWAKRLTGRPSITVGSVGLSSDMFEDLEGSGNSAVSLASIRDVAARLDRGEFDLVALGRSLIADSDWARKVREGRHDLIEGYRTTMLQTLA
jgi:2,4-dienoyl-CoA reductase-like NADH-dependent reductase (Old Yellow Enzyme family)